MYVHSYIWDCCYDDSFILCVCRARALFYDHTLSFSQSNWIMFLWGFFSDKNEMWNVFLKVIIIQNEVEEKQKIRTKRKIQNGKKIKGIWNSQAGWKVSSNLCINRSAKHQYRSNTRKIIFTSTKLLCTWYSLSIFLSFSLTLYFSFSFIYIYTHILLLWPWWIRFTNSAYVTTRFSQFSRYNIVNKKFRPI